MSENLNMDNSTRDLPLRNAFKFGYSVRMYIEILDNIRSENKFTEEDIYFLNISYKEASNYYRYFGIDCSLSVPSSKTEAKTTAKALKIHDNDIEIMDDLCNQVSTTHGVNASSYFRLGDYLALYLWTNWYSPPEYWDSIREKMLENGKHIAKECGIPDKILESILENPESSFKDIESLLDRIMPNIYKMELEGNHISAAPLTQGAPLKDYHVALSFAGEDRKHARELAELLKNSGFSVFYDEYEEDVMWGKDLYEHLSSVYSKRAQFCVMIISRYYENKLWTNHERKAAQARAFRESSEYILPLRVDDTEIPGLSVTTGYIDLREKSIQEVFEILRRKLYRKLKSEDIDP